MNDNAREAVVRTKRLLEHLGFNNVAVASVSPPDHIMAALPAPVTADKVVYFRVTTHLGTFGVALHSKGVYIDLTDLGLKLGDFSRYLEGIDRDEKRFLFTFRSPEEFKQFRQILEIRKSLN